MQPRSFRRDDQSSLNWCLWINLAVFSSGTLVIALATTLLRSA